jgi:hypothetical protein
MRVSVHPGRLRARSQQGFTLIVVLGVMLVSSLLLVAAFTAVNGDVWLAHEDLTQKQSYFAALAGVQAYDYQLEKNPDFWESCEPLKATQPQEASTRYEVTLMAASDEPEGTKCSTAKPFETVIESGGRAANTFRVKSKGFAGKDERTIIATFQVKGFLDYVYFTRFEDEDPSLDGDNVKECSQEREERLKSKANCGGNIQFAPEDSVRGPMHTDDAADACGEVEFGRKKRLEEGRPDTVEIKGGVYASECQAASNPVFNTATKTYLKGPEAEELIPPEEDTSLQAYVEPGYEFEGVTTLELEGKNVTVTNAHYEGGNPKQIAMPKNGLIYIRSTASPACGYNYNQENADTSSEIAEEVPCGTAYVKGTYTEALTIGAEKEIVIKGSVTPTGVTVPTSGEATETPPAGTATLGLIASKYVRMYHPCSGKKEEGPKNPWIYAAILSTAHSFLVDNYQCGSSLGHLNIFGAIAQNFRGIVGQTSGTGYLKNYNYDERLASDEPPYFLAPLKAGWKIARETAPSGG